MGELMTELNGGASIGEVLRVQLLNLGKGLIEQIRPWNILRATDLSKTVVAGGNQWQTAIDLSTLTRFNRFFGDYPVRVFDGNNGITYYRQVPFFERLRYRDIGETFVYDEKNKLMYLNGNISRGGTLWINHIQDTPDLEDEDTSTWVFPSWSHYIIPYLAVGLHKGGIDYDDINRLMAADNRSTAAAIMQRLETWDNEKQLSERDQYDPYTAYPGGYRSGAINMADELDGD